MGGKNWTKTDTDVVYGGYYAVDNLTNESDLRMCISEDTSTDNCSKNKNDIRKKQNGWVTYDKSKVLPVMNNASNGENHNIFVSIGDQPSVTLPSISKARYTCNWNTKSDGSGIKKNDGVSYIPNGNITVHTGATRIILGSGAKISATDGTGMYTNIGSGDYIHVLQGASISAKKSSFGLNSGKLCLSDNVTLSGNGKTGKDSIWKDSGASIVGAGASEDKLDNRRVG